MGANQIWKSQWVLFIQGFQDVFVLLPYIGLHSNLITKRLKSCVNCFYSFVNVKVIFHNTRHIKSFFPYNNWLNRSQLSKVIYKAGCWNCNNFYIGKTKRTLNRKTEHFKALLKHDHSSAIVLHVKTTGQNIKWDHFDILQDWLVNSRVTANIECQCQQRKAFTLLRKQYKKLYKKFVMVTCILLKMYVDWHTKRQGYKMKV